MSLYPNLDQIRSILVIKLRHHGDVLLSTPLFTLLKKKFPQARITAYVYEETEPMLSGLAAVTDFLLYDKRWKRFPFFQRVCKELSLLWKIRKQGYDLVLNLTEGDRGALAALASKARIRASFDPGSGGFFMKRKVYTHLAKVCKTARHSVERNLDLLRRIGIFPEEIDKELSFSIPQKAVEKARELTASFSSYVLIHAVSRWKFKSLSVAQMGEVVRWLKVRGLNVVMTTSQDMGEIEMVKEILAHANVEGVLNLSGKTSLKELAALIQGCQLLLTVDSLPLHLGSVFKKATLVFFGPTSELDWGPWKNKQAKVLTASISCRPCHLDGCGGSKRSLCLEMIQAREMIQAIEGILDSVVMR